LDTTVARDDKTKRRKTAENQAPPGRPLTARAVAELCGVELKTVHNWVAEGRLQHFRTPGRHLRFHPDAVQAFLRGLGYADPPSQRRVVIGASAGAAQRLRRVLLGCDCIWVNEPWSFLIAVGRHSGSGQPPVDALVIDSKLFRESELGAALRAMRRQLPTTPFFVIGETSGPSNHGVVRVAWDDLEVLRRRLGSQS
jgi:excisionase family DNA binding protein